MSTPKNFVPKADSAPVLFEGMGTPYLAIFNGQSKPIICPKNQLPIGTFVKNFEYTYTEEGPDSGEIMIETNNPDLLDHEDLQYYSELWLQWGYIFPDTSFLPGPPRKVCIIGMSSEFTEKGTTINLKVSDVGIMTKTEPSNYYNNMGGFEDYIKHLLGGDFVGDVTLIDYSKTESKLIPEVMQRVEDNDTVVYTRGHTDEQRHSFVNAGTLNIVHELIQVPNQNIPNQAGVVLLEYNAKTRQLVNNLPDTYRKVFIEAQENHTVVASGIPKNKFQQIKEFTQTLDNGPFYMDMRDGRLIIHNRAIGRPIYKVYTYTGGNGELLTFKVDSDFVTTAVEVSKSVDLDPVDKSVNTRVVQGLNNPRAGNLDNIDGYVTWADSIPFVKGYMEQGLNVSSNSRMGNPDEWGPFMAEGRHLNPDGSFMTPMQRDSQFFYQEATPKKVSAEKEFANKAEAEKYISANISKYISQEDLNNWFRNFKSQFDKWVKSEDIGEAMKGLQSIPNYTLKVKVKLQKQDIPDMVAAGIYLLQSGQSTEELVNMLHSGELNFSEMTYASVYNRPGVDQRFSSYGKWTINGTKYSASQAVQMVQTIVTEAGGNVSYVKEINPTGDALNRKYLKGTASYEVDIELPLAGARLLGDPRIKGSVNAMGADIEETVTDQMKATGTFIGDPILESSFNIQIQNVSKRYSGIWYTKKVVHKLSPEGGYTCDIEFVQRSVPVSTRTIQSTWIHSDFAKNIHEAAKKSLESGSWQKPTQTIQDAKSKVQDVSTLILQTEEGVKVKSSKDTMRSDPFSSISGNAYYPDNYVEALPEE